MQSPALLQHLKSKKKLHLEHFFSNLTDFQGIDQAILDLNLDALELQGQIKEPLGSTLSHIQPYHAAEEGPFLDYAEKGRAWTGRGKVGCILIAGGQGTRLNHSGPKGTFPISPIHQRSLFQIFAEKVRAASALTKQKLCLAIMTSPLNDYETQKHFEKHNYFGLKEDQVDFFMQPMLPFLDFDNKLILQSIDAIAKGPSGNGSLFEAFFNSPVALKWEKANIEIMNLVLVDNPLAEPFDFEMIGAIAESDHEIVTKGCQRQSANEKVGIFVQKNHQIRVIEYTEIPSSFSSLKEPLANLSLFALKMDFAKKMSKVALPLHAVQKKASFYDPATQTIIEPTKPNVWKFETFIFDILPYAHKVKVLKCPREEIFAPLKNLEGENNPKSVQKALMTKDQMVLKQLGGIKIEKPFELSADFYYPTESFKEKLKNPAFAQEICERLA